MSTASRYKKESISVTQNVHRQSSPTYVNTPLAFLLRFAPPNRAATPESGTLSKAKHLQHPRYPSRYRLDYANVDVCAAAGDVYVCARYELLEFGQCDGGVE